MQIQIRLLFAVRLRRSVILKLRMMNKAQGEEGGRKEGEKSCLEKNEKVARISYSLIEEKFKDRIFRVLISMMIKFNFWRYLRV